MIVVVGGGLVAVMAARALLDEGNSVMLTTAHAEFGFPHGGCGFWDNTVLTWPLPTLDEAVAAQIDSMITCRSQWLVKRLVHRFTDAGGTTSTRVRLHRENGVLHATGTGTISLDDVHHVILADQDVGEPAPSAGDPLMSHTRPQRWYGAVVAGGSTVNAMLTGQRSDGTTEVWTTTAAELDAFSTATLETMTLLWDEGREPINAARCAQRAREAVHDLMASGRLGDA